jgi:hypothetical protein
MGVCNRPLCHFMRLFMEFRRRAYLHLVSSERTLRFCKDGNSCTLQRWISESIELDINVPTPPIFPYLGYSDSGDGLCYPSPASFLPIHRVVPHHSRESHCRGSPQRPQAKESRRRHRMGWNEARHSRPSNVDVRGSLLQL